MRIVLVLHCSAEWEHFLLYNLKMSSLGTCVPLSPKGKAFSLDAARHSPRRGKLFLYALACHSPRGGESYSAEWEHFWQCNLKISSLDAARHSPRRRKLFSLGTCVPLSPKGKASEKIACYNKKCCASIFLIEAQHLFILSFLQPRF